MREEEYYSLLQRHLNGDLSETERAKLDSWLASSTGNRKMFEDFEKIWQEAQQTPAPRPMSVEDAWQDLEQRLAPSESDLRASIRPLKTSQPETESRISRHTRLWLAAAAAVLLAAASVLWRFMPFEPGSSRFTVPAGEVALLDLPDGSTVRLNSGSTIEFPDRFDTGTREIILSGEGYFSVVSDQSPFVVKTMNAEVRVLGTMFNVWARGEKTRVIVQEGQVALRSARAADEGVVLAANQMSVCRQDEPASGPAGVDAETRLGWLDRKLVFVQTPLSEIVEELRHHYAAEIELAATQAAERTVTATFAQQPLDSVLSSICLTLDLRYEERDGAYHILAAE